jgi:hypothetical protein
MYVYIYFLTYCAVLCEVCVHGALSIQSGRMWRVHAYCSELLCSLDYHTYAMQSIHTTRLCIDDAISHGKSQTYKLLYTDWSNEGSCVAAYANVTWHAHVRKCHMARSRAQMSHGTLTCVHSYLESSHLQGLYVHEHPRMYLLCALKLVGSATKIDTLEEEQTSWQYTMCKGSKKMKISFWRYMRIHVCMYACMFVCKFVWLYTHENWSTV